jgi:hypothetical protein
MSSMVNVRTEERANGGAPVKERFLRAAAVGVVAFMFHGPSTAGAADDHLTCHKIKDSLTTAQYTADLTGLTPEAGCTIRVPGRLLCVESDKSNVVPSPPGAPPGGAAGRFVCYKVKCPKAVLPPVTVGDQFGTRSVQPRAPKLVCAPAQPTLCCAERDAAFCQDRAVGSGCAMFVTAYENPGTVCDGSTGTCQSKRTGTSACCQTVSGCFEGPDAESGCLLAHGMFFNSGERCLTNGTCAP